MDEKNSISKNAHIHHSFQHAIHGLVSALGSERNLRIHWGASVLLCIFNLVTRPSVGLQCLGLAICCVVITVEMINTALEQVVDLATGQRWHPMAKVAKDVAAGAVLSISCMAMVLGAYLIYSTLPWRLELFTLTELPGALISTLFLVLLLLWATFGYRLARTKERMS